MPAVRFNQFAPYRVGVNRIPTRRFGAISTQSEIGAGSAVAGAAAGAAYGSVVPGIGTAVGAVVGLIASALVHTGQGPQRAAQSAAIDQALSQITTANHQGAAIPWNGTATAPGLQQFLQAIMTSGLWMSWDPSLISSPSVNGNWALTFIPAVKQVVQAIISNPVGKQVCLNITDKPGGNDAVAGQFCFINPGISVGPDVISAQIIMGNGGLMYYMIKRTGETDAHAAANANNAAAQKVFALMVDHAAYDMTPPPAPVAAPTPAPVATSGSSVAPATANTQIIAASTGTPAPTVTGSTAAGSPVVAPGDESALIAQLIAQGQSQDQAVLAAIQSMQANNVPVTPAVQQQLQATAAAAPSGLFGLSPTTLLIIGAIGVGAIFLMKKD